MESLFVVSGFDELPNQNRRLSEIAIATPIHLFRFEGPHEAFRPGIVIRIAWPAHADSDLPVFQPFDIVAARKPSLRLLIAGDGTQAQMQQLKALVDGARYKERIELLGPVSKERAAQLMREGLLLAMPSRYEAWPLSALEAGAVGIPVVGSDIVGLRDAAPQFPQAHGILVPQGNVQSLADAMDRVADDPAIRAEAGSLGRQWAARFNWDALADAQLAFYEEVVRET